MKTTRMSINIAFDLEVDQDDILTMLAARRAMQAAPELAAVTQAIDESIGIGGEPAPAPAPAPAPPAPAPAPAPTPPPPPAARAPAPAKAAPKPAPAKAANGATAAPAKPVVPTEAVMRAKLKEVNAIHPKSTAGVVELLEEIGGFKRLNECPAETWPAIYAAAEDYLASAAA